MPKLGPSRKPEPAWSITRYDGRSAMQAEKPSAETANLFTPAGWAFAIWARARPHEPECSS
jgi:hypothetical protein